MRDSFCSPILFPEIGQQQGEDVGKAKRLVSKVKTAPSVISYGRVSRLDVGS